VLPTALGRDPPAHQAGAGEARGIAAKRHLPRAWRRCGVAAGGEDRTEQQGQSPELIAGGEPGTKNDARAGQARTKESRAAFEPLAKAAHLCCAQANRWTIG
jgi:hypothetical protein